ncbi:MAG: thiamine phosphate synthase [Myxococcota bacterium]
MKREALRLYLVSDPRYPLAPSQLEALARAGVSMVQLRDKEAEGRALLETARRWLRVLRPLGVPLIVNDRVDVAAAAGADGVHLGQSDLPVKAARRILGEGPIIGLSLERPDAEYEGADYVAASPVFPTPTKTDTSEPFGLDGLRLLCERVRVPVVGIGGLRPDNAGEVMSAGAAGVAVVSAILGADDPVTATRTLRARVDAH